VETQWIRDRALYGSATSALRDSRHIVHQQAVAFIIDEFDMGML
jgi:hypothetical protein